MKEIKTTFILPVLFVLTGLLASYSPVAAQVGNYGLIYQGAYNNAMFLTTKNAIKRGIRSRSADTKNSGNISATDKPAQLNFASSEQVHTKVLQGLASMMAGGDQAKVQPNINVLTNGNFLYKFDQLLKQYGFNSRNLGDVVCAFTILSWQAATGGDAARYPAGIGVFRKNMQASLVNNTGIRDFNDAQRQELGETMSYIAVLITLANQDPATKNNPQALAQLRQNARAAALKFTGMDVTQCTLSQNGFLAKAN
jgi:hypothetical protein